MSNNITFNNAYLSNLPVIIALVLLSSAPFLILLNQQPIADQFAAYAYYFLVAGISWKVIQHIMNKNHRESDTVIKKRGT